MQIIPVLDLKDGCVVNARHGDRDHYRPLSSPLCSSSSLFAVIEAFLDLHDFGTFYIADLNAITASGDNQSLIDRLIKHYRDIEFWLDNGSRMSALQNNTSNLKTVIGSESQHQVTTKPETDFILSLDFKAEQKLGNRELFSAPQLWPQQIIIMTLNKVGSHSGPDFAKLHEYRQRHPDKNFIAAGGIRNAADLVRLESIGIDKALVASALHSGALDSVEIKNLQAKKYPG
ncbi:HisA/HisF-related TIM barrel protein [Methylomarinum sp. Ch1-1]|uniref:HisA/HisF-related TIM barrel protein n=1 Tax=Methylomarinum roseum TaxID=3067653 RepID=A0AAU7NRU3_9GAMM|nr:HisA/HisF-related TIM barrel protein [Methylomarinum sp. Ch1-1]MDP4520353.1 HisA/HisF-related TIM barrel protein [Methylomarinum sp. Ch1-1]